jgi:hypothetical protein
VKTDKGIIDGEQFPIIGLHYSLYFPSSSCSFDFGFEEEYLNAEALIRGANVKEIRDKIINGGEKYDFNDVELSERCKLLDESKVAFMIYHLREKGIKVELRRQYENGDKITIDVNNVIAKAINDGIKKEDLENYTEVYDHKGYRLF